MVDEARLREIGSGLAPDSPGWFVVNAAEAAWLGHPAFGWRCVFESNGRVVAGQPDMAPQQFAETGLTLAVLAPGKPSGLYHAESTQEDFLVLSGTCVAVIEEQERKLHAWDFLHCPPHTRHVFIGTGEQPCAILMLGARRDGSSIRYPDSELARSHGAGVQQATDSPHEAYADRGHWQPGRPEPPGAVPWEG